MTTPTFESPEAFNAEIVAKAIRFEASLFIGKGKYATAEATSEADIRAKADELKAAHPGNPRSVMIYAYDESGNQAVLNGAPKKAKPAKAKPAKAAKEPKAAKPKAEKKPAADKPIGKRAQQIADAEAGILPPKPDFSAPTHARFRKKLDEIAALVEKADIKALKAYPINPISSSPKAMDKYRNLAVTALEAQRKAAKAQQ